METRIRYKRSNMSEQIPKIAILDTLQLSQATDISNDDLLNRIRVLILMDESSYRADAPLSLAQPTQSPENRIPPQTEVEKMLAEGFKISPPSLDGEVSKLDPYLFLEQPDNYIEYKKLTERQVLDIILPRCFMRKFIIGFDSVHLFVTWLLSEMNSSENT